MKFNMKKSISLVLTSLVLACLLIVPFSVLAEATASPEATVESTVSAETTATAEVTATVAPSAEPAQESSASNVIKGICTVFLVISSIITIVSVLLQSGETSGLGAIAGGAETFFGKNKAKSYEGKLALATKVSACVFIAMTLIVAWITKVV